MESEKHPIRVVVFGGGPELTRDTKEFIVRLEMHAGIELAGVICQTESSSVMAVFKDLWKRRGLLALPLFTCRFIRNIARRLKTSRQEIVVNRVLDELSDRMHQVRDIHAQEVLEHVRSLAPDLGLIYGSPILKPCLFEIPALGTLGIHHGKIPDYRGNKVTFWAMYNDESSAGVTIQKVNAGLDTGCIVKEGEVPIGRRSYRKVWNELEALGLDLFIQAILDVRDGKATFRHFTGKKGKVYRNPKIKDFLVFWGKRSVKTANAGNRRL